MAVRTTIAPHYAWRCLIIAGVCLVLGVWGVYDYWEKIPSRIQAHERGDAAMAVRDAIWPPDAEFSEIERARELLEAERLRYMERYGNPSLDGIAPVTDEEDAVALGREVQEMIDSLRAAHQEPWARALVTLKAGLDAGRIREGEVLSGAQLFAYEVADRAAAGAAMITRPRAYDRPVQWMFILCLPFVPYFLWEFYRQKTRVYQLDDDGTLHLPGGTTWQPEHIIGIDMDRWMKKSIAYVEHADGTRIQLDEYKQKNLHLIVGAIASRLHPDQWDAEAKPVKAAVMAGHGPTDVHSNERGSQSSFPHEQQ